ncbi:MULTISPECIES: pyridoxal phosphate-dependent aminotransferase [unclassified Imperialibacter]|uniref:pyridoxal phosphate-dependent aminotransferase n=1 Tax=unclassified Imperialibacter TaxID=2629706 RepID=UPI001254305B|nr:MULTISPECIES: pyridoxal phosphate-dependent aminotransferase [unclassified Imperialibacter]CAD5271017.1 Aspartate aminotransferase [Imperialibacter sp. 75]CAD5298611.1 Aspartate aminotransferase [Imperialibacter sp. 89]VVT35660.1 Aspartate aminotransferase [Imperialibacter sp. EC-SDR9]
MSFLSKRVNALAESATLAMAKKARELKSTGVDIISLSLGEPDFKTPKHIQEAAKAAIDEEKYFAYSPVAGYQDLREAIAAKFRNENGLDSKPENIVVSTGAKQSIYNLMSSILDPGDEVIIFAPYWVSYSDIIQLCEGKSVLVSGTIENGYKPTAAQLEAAITPKTKALLYSSPCNPTGSVFSKEDFEGFVKVLAKHPQILILADEIYEHINYVGKHISIGTFPEVKDRTVTINGMAKGFAMTGWRIGFINAPKEVAQACEKIQGQVTSGTNTIAQRATVSALTSSLDATKEMSAIYRKRRDMVYDLLKSIPGLKVNMPEGAFYFFPDVSHYFGKSDGEMTVKDADDFCIYILAKAHVALVTGGAFGAPNAVRLSYAASEPELQEAIKRIKTALALLK